MSLTIDMTDEAAVHAAHGRVVETFGRIDVLSNNAGPLDPEDHCVLEATLEMWNRVITSVLIVRWLSCKHDIPHLGKEATMGSIINTASFPAGMSAATTMVARLHDRRRAATARSSEKAGLVW